MENFLRFFDEKAETFPMHLEISYNKHTDWGITIFKKGCAADYPNSDNWGEDALICLEQDCDMELCFAKAHVALKNWLSENCGGY